MRLQIWTVAGVLASMLLFGNVVWAQGGTDGRDTTPTPSNPNHSEVQEKRASSGRAELEQISTSFLKAWELHATKAIFGVMVVVLGFGWGIGTRRVGKTIRSLKRMGRNVATPLVDLVRALDHAPQTQRAIERYRFSTETADDRLVAPTRLSAEVSVDDFLNESGAATASRIPTLLTTLGLLGTFLGIAMALGDIVGSEATSNDNTHIVQKIEATVPGLASAFWTSIVGIVLALGFSFYSDRRESILRREFTVVLKWIDGITDLLPTGQKSLKSAVEFVEKQHRVLEQLHEALVGKDRFLDLFGRTLSEIQKNTGASEQTLKTLVTEVSEKLAQNISGPIAAAMELQFATLNDTLNKRMEDMRGDNADEARRFAGEAAESIGKQLSGAVAAMGQSIEQFGQKFGDLTTDLHTFEKLLVKTFDAQKDSAAATSSVIENAKEQVAVSADAVSRLQGAIERLDDAMRTSELVRAETDSMLQQQTEHHTRMGEISERSLSRIEQAAHRYAEFADRFERVTQQIGDNGDVLSKSVSKAALLSENAGVAMGQAASHLEQRIVAEKELLGQYTTNTQTMRQSLEQTQTTLQALVIAAKTVNESTNQLNQVGKMLMLVSPELQNSAEVLKNHLTVAAKSLSDAGTRLGQFVDATHEWAKTSTKAVQDFGEGLQGTLQRTMTTYDKALESAVNSLSTGIRELGDAIEDLHDKLAPTKGNQS